MTTFTPGDRFRIYGGRVAHVIERKTKAGVVVAHCGEYVSRGTVTPADDRPLCKVCARAMERNER